MTLENDSADERSNAVHTKRDKSPICSTTCCAQRKPLPHAAEVSQKAPTSASPEGNARHAIHIGKCHGGGGDDDDDDDSADGKQGSYIGNRLFDRLHGASERDS